MAYFKGPQAGGGFTYGAGISVSSGMMGAQFFTRAMPTATAPVTAAPPSPSVVTGIDPSEIHNVLYGKIIPLSALGLARIGTAGLIFGPYFNSGAASFAVSFGFPANPEGTRRVYEIALDGKVAWELAAGSGEGEIDDAGFLAEPFMCRFYGGTQTQPADPLEVAVFGAQAVAYRPQMMLWFSQLPVAAFGGKVPFVSCKIGDVTGGAVPADGINLGEALERVAYSPWLEMDDTFEATGVADIVQAMILTEEQSFLDLLRVTARVYRTLDIIQTDRLRINDRGMTVAPDVTLDRDRIVAENGVQYSRQEEASVPRELELITIDPDADYVFMPSKAARPLVPVPVTSSVAKDTITLPVVIGATTRASLVTYAKYDEDNARKRISLQTLLYGYELEPGDLFNLSNVADGFDDGEVWKVVETSHGANYVNELTGEAILKCALADEPGGGTDPSFANVGLLVGFNGTDGATSAIDESGAARPLTFVGNAQLDTAQSKFGGSSLLLDGTGDAVTTPFDAGFVFTGPATIEGWFRVPAGLAIGSYSIFSAAQGSGSNSIDIFWQNPLPSKLIVGHWYTDGYATAYNAASGNVAASLTDDAWHHVAFDRDSSNKLRLYLNGVMVAFVAGATSTNFATTSPISIGGASTTNFAFNGWLDEWRVSRISRYGDVSGDTSFTPPSAAFPRS